MPPSFLEKSNTFFINIRKSFYTGERESMPNSNLVNAKNNMKSRIRNRVSGSNPRDLGRLAKSARFVGLTDDAEVETDIDTEMAAAIPSASIDDLVEMSEGLKELRTGAADMGSVANADNLTEGGNKFLNATSVQPALSVSGDLSYNNGVVSYTAPTASALQVVATVGDLPAGASAGDQAVVQSNNKLYIKTADGWYAVALINTAPSISGNDAAYTLATDQTPTVITLTATDPENDPVTFSYAVTSGDLNGTTVQQADNVFTITPHGVLPATFELTFSANDTVNVATAVSSFSLVFTSDFSGVSRFNPTLVLQNPRLNEAGYNPPTFPQFGSVLAMSGNTIAAGSLYDVGPPAGYVDGNQPTNGFQEHAGSLHLIDASTGTVNHTLFHSYGAPSDWTNKYSFRSVAMDGDYVVAGVRNSNNETQANVYSASTGNLLHTLIDPQVDRPISTSFAQASEHISVSGNYAAIADMNTYVDGVAGRAAVYVYDLTTGNLIHTITPPYNSPQTQLGNNQFSGFGWSVAIDGDYVAIGGASAQYYDYSGVAENFIGSVWIWRISTQSFLSDRDFTLSYGGTAGYNGVPVGNLTHGTNTTQSHINSLQAPYQDRKERDYFGSSVALKNGMLFVGSIGILQHIIPVPSTGEGGKIFKYSLIGDTFSHIPDWTIENKDISYTAGWAGDRRNDRLGYRISTDGMHLLASSHYVNGNEGAAYIFDVTDGSLVSGIVNGSSNKDYGKFGVIDGDTIAISAGGDDSYNGIVRVWKV